MIVNVSSGYLKLSEDLIERFGKRFELKDKESFIELTPVSDKVK